MNLIYLVVEGITDVALYRAFLKRCFSFEELTHEEEKEIHKTLQKIDWKNFFGNILPLKKVRMLRQDKSSNTFIIIHGAGGKPALEEKAKNLEYLLKEKEERIRNLLGNSILTSMKIFLIADQDNPWERPYLNDFIFLLSQPLPEELILKCTELDMDNECLQKAMDYFKELKNTWNKINKKFKELCKLKSDEAKQEINLLKSLIGERCHDHLLEELLHNMCCRELEEQLKEIIEKILS